MNLDLSQMSSSEIYFAMTQVIIPRPIAWVLSLNDNGSHNLAPFSYFNAVASNPPLIMISIGKRPDGRDKDTRINIQARQHFVVHIAHGDQLEALNRSSAGLEPDISEVTDCGLDVTPFDGFALPRLNACRVALACRFHQVIEIGDTPQALILGQVDMIHISDDVATRDDRDRLTVDAKKLDPLARLGASEYALFGTVNQLKRPQ